MIWVFLLFCLLLVGTKTRFSLFSPVVLFILFFCLAIALTIPYHFLMPKDEKFSIAAVDYISDKKFWAVIEVFVRMLIYFLIGVLIYKYLLNVRKNPPLNLNIRIKLPSFNSNTLIAASLGIVVMDLILLYYTYGADIFYREKYHSNHNTLLTMLLEYSLLFLVFIGGVLYKGQKFYSVLLALFVILLCIGFGSRMATIYLMIYLFTIFILYVKKKNKKYFVI